MTEFVLIFAIAVSIVLWGVMRPLYDHGKVKTYLGIGVERKRETWREHRARVLAARKANKE